FCLHKQGKPAQALPLFQKALAIRRKVLGEQHPATATSYINVASILHEQGKTLEAVRTWQAALVGLDVGRLDSAATGFDRATFQASRAPVRQVLATAFLRLGKPLEAWEHVEADLARG